MQSISGMASSIHERRFLKYRKILESSIPISPSTHVSARSTVVTYHVAKTCFDWSIAIILGTLLCFVLCALIVSALLRYRLRCRQQRRASEPGIDVSVEGVKSDSGKKIDIRAMPAPVNGTGSPLASMDCPPYSTEIVEGEKVSTVL